MPFHDDLARRNAVILAGAQGLAGANASVIFATGALVGAMLAPSTDWATAPITAFVLGTAAATMPAAWLMRLLGRREAYRIGAAIGGVAGLISAYAVYQAAFWVFMVSAMLCGAYQAFVISYRFGATDSASPALRPKLISYVTLGGLASAVVGPQLVIHTKDLWPPYTFMASYIGQAVVATLSILLLSFLRFPPVPVATTAGEVARPLREVFRARRLQVAVICGAIAQALMNLIMTATPLAMVGCDHTTTDATLAIQWHIVGMFAPGLFTGALITRFGVYRIMALGLVLMAGCGVIAMAGITVSHFFAALILLGLGWNFTFVGASSLVVDGLRPTERTRVQGMNDLLVFATTSVASLSSGKILAGFGWGTLNLTIFPFVILAMVLVIWLARHEARKRA